MQAAEIWGLFSDDVTLFTTSFSDFQLIVEQLKNEIRKGLQQGLAAYAAEYVGTKASSLFDTKKIQNKIKIDLLKGIVFAFSNFAFFTNLCREHSTNAKEPQSLCQETLWRSFDNKENMQKCLPASCWKCPALTLKITKLKFNVPDIILLRLRKYICIQLLVYDISNGMQNYFCTLKGF